MAEIIPGAALVVSIVGPLVWSLLRLEHRLTHIEATIQARFPPRNSET